MRRLFCLLLVLILVFSLCGCSYDYEKYAKQLLETENPTENEIAIQGETIIETEAPTPTIEETVVDSPVYYEDDENINLYITRFNECNSDYLINADDLQKYYHHGQEHDDQVKFIRDDYEIVITGGYLGNKVEVYIGYTASSSHSNDEYGTMFIRFAKAFNSELTSDVLEGYWQQVVDNSSSIIDFDDFECQKSPGEKITYFKLSGDIE